MKLFGYKCRMEVLICIFLLGMAVQCFLFGSCSKMSMVEGFDTLLGKAGAPLGHKMGEGIHNSWDSATPEEPDVAETYVMDDQNQSDLFFLAKNKFHPTCCPFTFSNSKGCACMTTEQKDYLNRRGGNRACGAE